MFSEVRSAKAIGDNKGRTNSYENDQQQRVPNKYLENSQKLYKCRRRKVEQLKKLSFLFNYIFLPILQL